MTRPWNYKHVDLELLRRLYLDEHLTTHEIARIVGLSQRQTYLRIKEMGIIRTHGDAIRGKKFTQVGDRRMTHDGYWAIYHPEHANATRTGWILEHRYVMSDRIGRPLRENEVVHHINENRLDNRVENLKLYSSAGEHSVKEHRNFKTNEQMLTDLFAMYQRLKRPIRQSDLRPQNNISHAQTYVQHFGSWHVACDLARVPHRVKF